MTETLDELLTRTAWALVRRQGSGRTLLASVTQRPGAPAALAGLITERWLSLTAQGWTRALGLHAARKLSRPQLGWLGGRSSGELVDGLVALAFLLTLRPLPVPPPGAGTGRGAGGDRSADDRWLHRVRALLAKAESSEFPEEAEALTAKAQQLVTAHALEDVLDGPSADARPSLLHVPVSDPYADAKAMLLHVIAAANRGQAIQARGLGIVTVFAFPADLEAIELLHTSLLVQATRAMAGAGEAASQRQSGYRKAFLMAFAQRIGERLKESERVEVDLVQDDRLLPVLAARDLAVTAAAAEAFPGTVTRQVTVSNRHGWAAGRAAADRAELAARHAVGSK